MNLLLARSERCLIISGCLEVSIEASRFASFWFHLQSCSSSCGSKWKQVEGPKKEDERMVAPGVDLHSLSLSF